MPHLIWSPSALTDIQRLHRFLVLKDKATASRAIKAVRAGVKILMQFPDLGRPVEDMDPSFREWIIPFGSSGYSVLYRFNGEAAIILAVRHQKESGYLK